MDSTTSKSKQTKQDEAPPSSFMFDGSLFTEVKVSGDTNLTAKQAHANIEVNIRRGLPQVKPMRNYQKPPIICGGGPSLKRYIKSIKKKWENGRKVVTMNGTHDFVLDHGITPSAQVVLDGRPFNVRFLRRPVQSCAYFLASHCDPSLFDALEGYDVTIFHTGYRDSDHILKKYYYDRYMVVQGGSTVMLRTIFLLRTLGIVEMEIYGFDSCLFANKHHSYEQEENDEDPVVTIVPDLKGEGRRKFYCSPWMVSQAMEFQEMIRGIGEHVKLAVHGPGLIAHMIRTGAKVPVMKGD